MASPFGMWEDRTSRLIYHDAMWALLSGIGRTGSVADLGGANGLSRNWFTNVTTVDLDAEQGPDVVADLMDYEGEHDLVLLRYVLHYMPDAQVRRLFQRLARWHRGSVLVVQFVNDDLPAKQRNSVGEERWFRSEPQLLALLTGWQVQQRLRLEYEVDPQFYRNLLGHPNPTAHQEAVVSLLLERREPTNNEVHNAGH